MSPGRATAELLFVRAAERRKGVLLVRLTRENAFVEERRALHFADMPGLPEPPVGRHRTLQLVRAIESAAAASRRLATGEAGKPEREALRGAVQRGVVAKRALVEANLWSAWWYAHLRVMPLTRPRCELEDLVQEGVIGLLEAVEAIGSAAGEVFDSYAQHWMQDAVRSASGERPLPRRPGSPRTWRPH